MDSIDEGFERNVEHITIKDIKEGDKIRIKTQNNEYTFLHTAGMLVAQGNSHPLENAFGVFCGVRFGESLEFGLHHTSSIKSLVHIRPSIREAINLSPEASLALRVRMKIALAGKGGISLSAEESRALRELYGIAPFSPKQERE